jgi:hypothetical protein
MAREEQLLGRLQARRQTAVKFSLMTFGWEHTSATVVPVWGRVAAVPSLRFPASPNPPSPLPLPSAARVGASGPAWRPRLAVLPRSGRSVAGVRGGLVRFVCCPLPSAERVSRRQRCRCDNGLKLSCICFCLARGSKPRL